MNGMETNMGDDSDSIGNVPRRGLQTSSSVAGPGITMPIKEKRKPFFKKVCESTD
jgi:hypothetical protein